MNAVPKPKGRPKNAKKKANHERAYGEKAAWIRAQDCCACQCDGNYDGKPQAAAHTASGGTGRKADASTLVALCQTRLSCITDEMVEGCHEQSHRIGVKTFEKKWGVDLKAKAADYEARWQTFVSAAP
jgi:hypothetical protein